MITLNKKKNQCVSQFLNKNCSEYFKLYTCILISNYTRHLERLILMQMKQESHLLMY